MLSVSSTTVARLPFRTNPNIIHAGDRPSPRFFSVGLSSSLQGAGETRAALEEKELGLEQHDSVALPPIRVKKRVILVRHGQSTWNEEGRIQGSSDSSLLTSKGEAQAQTCRQMLVHDAFDVCFTSPLARSKRTAEIIWGSRREKMITENGLREIDLYSFQGLLKQEGKAKFGAAYRQWQADAANFNIDSHYPVRELWARARTCWSKIMSHDCKSILVVAHNAVNQALVATAIGLEADYFRILLQSNCGVSVLDFIPHPKGGSPYICLNRLNQTPSSPVAAGSSGGRKSSKRIILVCHGSLKSNAQLSQKTAELLLNFNVDSIVSGSGVASLDTAMSIYRFHAEAPIVSCITLPGKKDQVAADRFSADPVPRHVKLKKMQELDNENILQRSTKVGCAEGLYLQPGWLTRCEDAILRVLWDQSGMVWLSLLDELSDGTETVVVCGHPVVQVALVGHCLNLSKERLGSFHLDANSISIIEFPDGTVGRGVVRCMNNTAHLGRWSVPITASFSGAQWA